MTERVVPGGEPGIELWTESWGDPTDPTILLIAGASSQAVTWPDELCAALVAGDAHVVRYDNRDTGLSTCVDYAERPYLIADLARDAVAVLDAYGVGAAHLVGGSMGGMIAQQVAIDHPDRVATLTSIMSTPASASLVGGPLAGDPELGLPGASRAVLEALTSMPADWFDLPAEERIAAKLPVWRAVAGTFAPFDEERVRRLDALVISRERNARAADNHSLVIARSPDRSTALARVTAPTLVIHGTLDPVIPFEHGLATAAAIPGAVVDLIEGLGHELPVAAVPRLATAILAHAAPTT